MRRRHVLGVTAGIAIFAASSVSAYANTLSPTYVVKPGDTYYKIGQAVGQPWAIIETINTPGQTMLMPGQVLTLANSYTVQSGDTVWKIAQAHGIPASSIISDNHLSNPSLIYPGQQLWLESAGASGSASASASASATTTTSLVASATSAAPSVAVTPTTSTAAPAPTVPVTPPATPSTAVPTTSSASSASAAPSPSTVTPVATTTASASTTTTTVAAQQAALALGQEIVSYAERLIGTRYQWGGESTTTGFDCSGLVQTVFTHFQVPLPRTCALQATYGQPITMQALQPGDIVFFNTTGATYSHDGIYIGNGEFISATVSKGVVISQLGSTYWAPLFTKAMNPFMTSPSSAGSASLV